MPQESPAIPGRSSLISKLTNRFNNRTRVISDFYIEPEDPWRTYYAGDIVKGTVVLAVIKPLRVTHLTVCLHGFAKVYRNTVIASETPLTGEHGLAGELRSRKGGEYMGNGYASLFEDEVSLCGEGRLKEGQYRFMFELEFPSQSLPSSINFERGTISYLITSTLTRPTTISPIFTCDKRLIFAEAIDIGPLATPKPRFISLEPVSRKQKSKAKVLTTPDLLTKSVSHSPQVGPLDTSLTPTRQPPRSPAPSDLSHSSTLSSSVQSSLNTPAGFPSTRENDGAPSPPASSLLGGKQSITAMVELLKGGGLPGDLLPLKIVINHTKPLRSTNGIVITLYRQGKVDWKPLGSGSSTSKGSSKGKKPAREEAYPKSRTGLGVLSFGGARTNSLFRKDLSQTFAPLVVDPTALKAAVNTSIRIPEDVFPTIRNVPGGMISFRYFVEVVMDLRGRLDRYLPTPATSTAGPASYSYSPAAQSFDIDQGRNFTSTFGGNILDTDQVRRDKSVVSCSFEVVIGTKDTSRKYDRPKRVPPRASGEELHAGMSTLSRSRSHVSYPGTEGDFRLSDEPLAEQQGYEGHAAQSRSRLHSVTDPMGYNTSGAHPTPDAAPQQLSFESPPPVAPPPELEGPPPPELEEPVDEKARLRQAEETLLPSRPPEQSSYHDEPVSTTHRLAEDLEQSDNPPSFSQYSQGQLQFPLLNEDTISTDHRHAFEAGPSMTLPIRDGAPLASSFSSSQVQHALPLFASHYYTANESSPSSQHINAPFFPSEAAVDESSNGQPVNDEPSSQHNPQVDDKQELERQRLLAAASVPDSDAPSATHSGGVGRASGTMAVPHALSEEDFLQHTPATDALPRYQQ